MVLGDLESREGIRLKRIEEVRRMINQLRCMEVRLVMLFCIVLKVGSRKELEDTKKGCISCHNIKSIELKPPRWRPTYTKEAIAVSIRRTSIVTIMPKEKNSGCMRITFV